jgi:branched-chain amino acid transport system substrate-binding protein
MPHTTGWIASAAAVSIATLFAAFGASSQSDDLRIGVLAPLTGGGAASGLAVQAATSMAAKEINEKGGILGRRIVLVPADNRTDPTATVSEALRLTKREKVSAIVGPTSSQDALATAPVFNEAKVASINTAGSMALTPQANKYGFSTLINADVQGQALVSHVVDVLKLKSAAVLTDAGANSKSLVQAVKAAAAQRGLRITGTDEFEVNASDMTPQLLSLRKGNPDALIASGLTGDDMGHVINGTSEIGWKVKLVGSTTIGMVTSRVAKIATPGALKGDRISGQDYKAFTYCPGDAGTPSPFTDFQKRLKAFTPDAYDKLPVGTAALIYDSVYLLKAAIEATRSTDGEKVAAWIEANASSVATVSGRMSASPSSHFLFGTDAVAQVVDLEDRRVDGLRRRAGCPA